MGNSVVQVVWTPEAEFRHEQLLSYLSKEWENKVVMSYLKRLDSVINSISENPNLYQKYNFKKDVYKCVVTKHISLLYRIKSDKIYLLTFWDNRKNPLDLTV